MTSVYVSRGIRPYWHVDVKWIAGILLFLSLSACLALFNLWNLTTRDTAINISATAIANLYSQNGLDYSGDFAQFRQQAATSPSNIIKPLSQFPTVQVSKHDALSLSPRDLRIAIFNQITGPIYDLGVKNAATQFTSNPADQAKFVQQANLLGFVTKHTHDTLQKLFLLATIATLISAAAMVYFSAGWGRLVSPGAVLLLVTPVGTVFGLIFSHPQTGKGSLTATLPPNIVAAIGDSLTRSYLYAAVLGAGLLITALLGKAIMALIHRFRG